MNLMTYHIASPRGPGRDRLVRSSSLAAPAVPAAGVTFSGPGLLTSVGQSSDVAIAKVLLNTQLKLGLDYKPTAQPADLPG